MKVLFHGYNTCFQNPNGGIQNRMSQIKESLCKQGVEVRYFDPVYTKLKEFDILHVFKLTYESYPLIHCAKKMGLKVVVSPIVNLNHGTKTDLFFRFLNYTPLPTTYRILKYLIDDTDLFIVETAKEKEFFHKHYLVKNDSIKILPNGIDVTGKISTYEGDDIFRIIGNDSKYMLMVSRINENKNILNVIKAIGPTGIGLVIIGGPDKDDSGEYYQKCLVESQKYSNVYMLGWVDNTSDLLASAYRHAEVFVMASYNETFGLSLIEAGIAGAKLAISNTLPILDYSVFSSCRTFNPASVADIQAVLVSLFHDQNNEDIKKMLIRDFSWESISKELVSNYKQLFGEY